ncbi:hypothetical protein LTR10_008636 [Elasticomyces elasticus]|nr:hypothetical protein LTR10_008636 [Elasticomyces elasticus]KAK4974388.1 hypothetical protein LTR42_005032 [Elasticomyces elasticus]
MAWHRLLYTLLLVSHALTASPTIMKFRASLQIPRDVREDSVAPEKQSTPFKMSSLRHKKSKPWINEDINEHDDLHNASGKQDTQPAAATERPQTSRKQAMQDFLRNTSSQLKATGSSLRASASSKRLPHRFPVRKSSRVAKQPNSKRNSQMRVPNRNSQQVRSFEIKDDVIDRLMGPDKPAMGRIQSDQFLIKQRMRASSRNTSSTKIGPVSPVTISSAHHTDVQGQDRVLGESEVENMFVGAPYFNVVNEAGGAGQYRPQVIFRGGHVEESRRYGTDYNPVGHQALEASTLGLHRTKEGVDKRGRPHSIVSISGLEVAAELPGDSLLEMPNMLSVNGLDLGTIGFEHFLQLPIADSTILPDVPVFFEKRILLYSEPATLGLREMSLENLIDRLMELSDLHAAQKNAELAQEPWNDEKIAEMGVALFARLLDGELGTTSAGTGDVSLKTQITALQRVLSERELWHDFGQVEWRIRVGQLLWAGQDVEAAQLDEQRQPSERDVLLLQLTLAAELSVRLQALKRLGLNSTDQGAINAAQTRKLQWDVVLARVFLENLTISPNVRQPTSTANKRSSLFSTMSFFTARETDNDAEAVVQPLLYPKNEALQLSGLLHFAEALQWPHADDVRTQLEERLTKSDATGRIRDDELNTAAWAERPVSGVSVYATPLSSPRFPPQTPGSTKRHSYFGIGSLGSSPRQRPGLSRMTTAQSMQLLAATGPSHSRSASEVTAADDFEVGGWLSRSWLAGLVLPGEPASHFLISTLLENSPQALDVLGDAANLYGGFIYKGRGFWSKMCVVGRVMAARAGAKECGGWVSVLHDVAGDELQDGWVDVAVKDLARDEIDKSRVRQPGLVLAASDPLHGAEASSLQHGDFTVPLDGLPVMGNEVTCHGLKFVPGPGPIHGTRADVAQLTFSSPINLKLARLEVQLTYDVHFVASYPCHPQKPLPMSSKASSPVLAKPVDSPLVPARKSSSPERPNTKPILKATSEERPVDSERTGSTGTLSLLDIEKALPPPPAHPLHKQYGYRILSVASLLSEPAKISDGKADEVLILDCRGSEDLGLLARAWCAQTGVHAIVGKEGRTCLACCVREAKGLGVEVVIRI